jgi:hypothetical protein
MRLGLFASCNPLCVLKALSFPLPLWDEKVLSLLIETPAGELATHTAHIPNGSANGWAKVEVLEAVYAGLSAGCRAHHTVLWGDFNSRNGNSHPAKS